MGLHAARLGVYLKSQRLKHQTGDGKMKRSIRKNIYGNWVGYVGRNRVEEFGEDERGAAYWLKTGDEDWFTNAYL